MNTIRKFDLDRFLCWVLTLSCAIVIVVLASAIVMGLAQAIINIVRGEPNETCFKTHEKSQVMRSKRIMTVSVSEVNNTKI